jgi:NUMOD3 motif
MQIQIYDKSFEVLDFDEIKGRCFGFIYVTVNNITGKKYLGLHNTWRRDYIGSGNYMKAAIKKYGRENFTRYIIDTADSYEDLCNLEAYYITEAFGLDISHSDDWYNITSGLQRGGNTWAGMTEDDRQKRAEKVSKALSGRKHSEEQVEKNRRAQLKRMANPKERQKVAEATKAAMADPEVRKRMSAAKKDTPSWNKGKKMSEAARQKMSSARMGKSPANKGVPKSEEAKMKMKLAKCKPYSVYLNGNPVITDLKVLGGARKSLEEICRQLGVKIPRRVFERIVNTDEEYQGIRIERNENHR